MLVSATHQRESSDQISRSVVSDSLRPHESQHSRPPCSSATPEVHSDSCPSSQWWHPAISSSVVPFPSCPQSLTASESFPMSQLFAWGGQSARVSAWEVKKKKKKWGGIYLQFLGRWRNCFNLGNSKTLTSSSSICQIVSNIKIFLEFFFSKMLIEHIIFT